jgi:hypothetical protein
MTLSKFYACRRWFFLAYLFFIVLFFMDYRLTAIVSLITLSAVGALLGFIIQFHYLPCRCDLCSHKAKLIAKYQDGFGNRIMLRCENCGLVANASRFGIVIEKYDPYLAENEDRQI